MYGTDMGCTLSKSVSPLSTCTSTKVPGMPKKVTDYELELQLLYIS